MARNGLTDSLSSLMFPRFPKPHLASLPSEWLLQKLFVCTTVLGVAMKTLLFVMALQYFSMAFLGYKNMVGKEHPLWSEAKDCGWDCKVMWLCRGAANSRAMCHIYGSGMNSHRMKFL